MPVSARGQEAPNPPVAELLARLDTLAADVERLEALQAETERENRGLESGNAMLTTLLRAQMGWADSVRAAQATQGIPDLGLKAFWTFVVAVGAWCVAWAMVWFLERRARYAGRWNRVYARAAPIAPIVIWTLAGLLTVNAVWGIEASALVTAVAAGIVAVAFTAQDVLKNAFAGLVIALDPPFQLGDKISVSGTYGEVVSIGVLSTRIVTPDDSAVTVPNAQIVAGQVSNANSGETNCQVVTDLFLPGWVDEGRAKKIAFEAAATSKFAFLEKPIVVIVRDVFKETFLTHLKVKAYVLHPRHEFLFMSDVTERARAGFREAGLLPPMHRLDRFVDMGAPVQSGEPSGRAENGEPGT